MIELPSTLYVASEPDLVVGLTGTELTIVMLGAFAFCLFTSLTVYLLLPVSFTRTLSLSFLASIGVAAFVRRLLVRTKRNRPNGYYVQLIQIQFERLFGGNRFIRWQGYWDFAR